MIFLEAFSSTLSSMTLEYNNVLFYGLVYTGLCERVTNRENAPIAKVEAPQVLESLWESLKRDVRLRFYILPQRRSVLRIWDRNQHHDPKGNVEEPVCFGGMIKIDCATYLVLLYSLA